MSPLSMSQRAEPGPIYKVSWPEGSRLAISQKIPTVFMRGARSAAIYGKIHLPGFIIKRVFSEFFWTNFLIHGL